LLDIIEILVDNVEPCKPYRFNLKVVSPQGTTLGEIDSLILPPLPEMADYHPPPLAQLFRVQLQGAGKIFASVSLFELIFVSMLFVCN